MGKIDRYVRTIPKLYKPRVNPVVKALLEGWASGDDDIVTQLKNTKAQLFVKTAEGQYLDRLASGLGVSRPSALGLLDPDFQQLVPNLSLKAKQVRKIFYDTMDVFWGPLFSRANIQTANAEPFNVSTGDHLEISIDGGPIQDIQALAGDIAVDGAATADEIAAILSRIDGAVISVIEDQVSGDKYVNVRTDTPGARGSVQVFTNLSPTMVGTGKLEFNLKKNRITDIAQRTVVYEIRPRELIIELPAIVPALRRTLRGSHHLHADSTIEPAVPPANGVWQGSFLFSPGGVSYTVTRMKAQIQETLISGNVYTKVTVDDASLIPNEPGFLIFDWGMDGEEQPVKYISRPNNSTILLDPGHVFNKTHTSGAYINVILPDLKPLVPRTSGEDLAIYLTSPGGARAIVQDLLKKLAAAGVILNFVVLLPEYDYLCKNPYEGS